MRVFIDETGDHDLDHIDAQYPIFALGALLISDDQYLALDAEVKFLKREFFGDDGTFVLHSSELKRPYDKRSDPRNSPMLDPERRAEFYRAFDNRIMRVIDFKIALCVVRKEAMRDKYQYPMDPYHFSFENLLNRIMGNGGKVNEIYAEKRGRELDAELLSEYERLSRVGIHSYPSESVVARTRLRLVAKSENVNGLQAMDLLLATIMRFRLGKGAKMKNNDLDPALAEARVVASTTFPRLR
ncbi:MAG: DUF3800 domain-containing protein [Candidatus Paceibacterota bacterium]|jgi:hypothetical protein